MHTDKNNSSTPDKSLTVANSSGVAALPDPLWPAEVIPTHLSPADRRDPEVKEAWDKIGIDLDWRCAECGSTVDRNAKEPTLCNKCYAKKVEARALATKTNEGWQELASSLGLAIYERQPEETDLEWRIWQA